MAEIDAVLDLELITRRAISGVVTFTLRTFFLQVFTLIATFILTVLLDPAAFGIFFVVSAILNLFVYFSTRDINYLFYIGFVASYLLFHLTLNGYTFAHVWPNAVRWNSIAIATFMASTELFTCLFADGFLRLRKKWCKRRLKNTSLRSPEPREAS